MCKFAEKLGEDVKKWEIVGLLHDLDYDLVEGDMSKHGVIACHSLEGKIPEDCLSAIKRHDHRTGLNPKSKLDKAIIIADSLANIIERIVGNKLSLRAFEDEIERVSTDKPWLKENILRCEDIGITKTDLLTIYQKLSMERKR